MAILGDAHFYLDDRLGINKKLQMTTQHLDAFGEKLGISGNYFWQILIECQANCCLLTQGAMKKL